MFDLTLARSVNYKVLSEELAEAYTAAGIRNIEIALGVPPVDFDEEEMKQKIADCIAVCRKAGIEILSVHLPYGPSWELCVPDAAVREHAVEQYRKLLGLLSPIHPRRYVLHPGYPGVPAAERAERIRNFRQNAVLLSKAAAPAKIAVEDMPQDCLGNTAEELIALVDGLENICVCCDTNHFYQELTHDAVRKLGTRIETMHINDYDGKTETHWLAGDGVVEWNKVLAELERIGYRGPFLYECGQKYSAEQVAESKRKIFSAYHQSKTVPVCSED